MVEADGLTWFCWFDWFGWFGGQDRGTGSILRQAQDKWGKGSRTVGGIRSSLSGSVGSIRGVGLTGCTLVAQPEAGSGKTEGGGKGSTTVGGEKGARGGWSRQMG
jgi:hypothetical protein